MITGWRGLVGYTGLSLQYIQKATALYGFPKPVQRESSRGRAKVWLADEVLFWLIENNVRSA